MILGQSTSGLLANQTIGVFRTPQYGNTSQANTSTLIATAKITTAGDTVAVTYSTTATS